MRIVLTEQQVETLTNTLTPKREEWNKERLMNLVTDNPKYLDIEGNPYDYSLVQYDVFDRIKVRNEIPIVCHSKFDYGNKEGEEHGEEAKTGTPAKPGEKPEEKPAVPGAKPAVA